MKAPSRLIAATAGVAIGIGAAATFLAPSEREPSQPSLEQVVETTQTQWDQEGNQASATRIYIIPNKHTRSEMLKDADDIHDLVQAGYVTAFIPEVIERIDEHSRVSDERRQHILANIKNSPNPANQAFTPSIERVPALYGLDSREVREEYLDRLEDVAGEAYLFYYKLCLLEHISAGADISTVTAFIKRFGKDYKKSLKYLDLTREQADELFKSYAKDGTVHSRLDELKASVDTLGETFDVERERHMVAAVKEAIEQDGHRSVAVFAGAEHVPGLIKGLSGYQILVAHESAAPPAELAPGVTRTKATYENTPSGEILYPVVEIARYHIDLVAQRENQSSKMP